MATDAPAASLRLDLRAALVIGLAAALSNAICKGVGLTGESLAYGPLIGALVVRPDFSRWPALIYPVLVVLVGVRHLIGHQVTLAELLELLLQDLEEIQVVSILGLQMLAEAVERDRQAKQVDQELVELVAMVFALLLQDQTIR